MVWNFSKSGKVLSFFAQFWMKILLNFFDSKKQSKFASRFQSGRNPSIFYNL